MDLWSEIDEDDSVIGNDAMRTTSENYLRFGRMEAHGRSPLYEEFSEGVAGDPEVLALLGSLPSAKRQPNLVLGAVRYLYDVAPDYAAFRRTLVEHWDEVSSTMLVRRTQTNEVARCATLLPLLLALPQPIALFEVGASAGLCLLADRYRYDFGEGGIGPSASPVTLRCECRGPDTPLPTRLPEVVWRAGSDLDPIDVQDEDAVRWLEALIWPGEGDRLARLRGGSRGRARRILHGYMPETYGTALMILSPMSRTERRWSSSTARFSRTFLPRTGLHSQAQSQSSVRRGSRTKVRESYLAFVARSRTRSGRLIAPTSS